MLISFSDDPSVTVKLTRPGPAADHPRPAMVAQGRNKQEEQESSEIDTDDEIAAVQQVTFVQRKTCQALRSFWSHLIYMAWNNTKFMPLKAVFSSVISFGIANSPVSLDFLNE